MKKILFLFVILTFSTEILGQSSFGVRHEPFRISIKYDFNEILAREASTTNLWSEYGFALSYSLRLTDLFGVSTRLGFVSKKSYHGPELTLTSDFYYWKDCFALLGINLHENIMTKWARGDLFPSYLVGIGVRYQGIILSVEYLLPLIKQNIERNESGKSEIQNILKISYGFEF